MAPRPASSYFVHNFPDALSSRPLSLSACLSVPPPYIQERGAWDRSLSVFVLKSSHGPFFFFF